MSTFVKPAGGLSWHVRVLPGTDEAGRECVDITTYCNGYEIRGKRIRLYKTPDGWDKANIYLNSRGPDAPYTVDFDLDLDSPDPEPQQS